MSDAALEDEDLAHLVAQVHVPLVAVHELTPLPAKDIRRRSFRLEFADGSVRKGRMVQDEGKALEICTIHARLEAGDFAQILAHRGTALLEEWVPGPSLDQASQPSAEVFRAAGRIMGRMHRVEPQPEVWGPRHRSGEGLLELFQERLVVVRESGVLGSGPLQRLQERVHRETPGELDYGFIHRDLCGENLVLVGEDSCRSIDNASLCHRPRDWDLARTRYRWPMQEDSWQAFLDGYREYRSPEGYLAREGLWQLFIATFNIAYRLRAGIPDIQRPRRELLRHLGEN